MSHPTAHFAWEHDPTIDRHRTKSPTAAELGTAGVWQTAWELKRDPPRTRDHKLSALAAEWLAAMPETARPAALCKHFPRIANRLALCWSDAILSKLLLDELLQDRRGGRKGFPAAVRGDLTRLAAELTQRRAAAAAVDGRG